MTRLIQGKIAAKPQFCRKRPNKITPQSANSKRILALSPYFYGFFED
jgi:hypothetical protein